MSTYLDNEKMAAAELHSALIAVQEAQGYLMKAHHRTTDTNLIRFCAEFEGTLSLLRGVGNTKLNKLTDFIASEEVKLVRG